MVTLLSGLIGGLIATILMTVFMMLLGDDSPPPTALFWSKFVGSGGPEEYVPHGMLLHFIYGIVAGGVFAILVENLEFISVASLELALLWGIVYGILLFLGAAVFWMNIVLNLDPERRMVGLFLLFHLIYGLVLGGWVGIGISL